MTREEKNRKLLEFVGFRVYHYGIGAWTGLNHIIQWEHPDGSIRNSAPDFFDPEHGIAWGFKWLYPELRRRGYDYELYGWQQDEHKCIIVTRAGHWRHQVSKAIAKEPAVALAEAVLKLLEVK